MSDKGVSVVQQIVFCNKKMPYFGTIQLISRPKAYKSFYKS